jgi:predicted PurR-regulated permease PerM
MNISSRTILKVLTVATVFLVIVMLIFRARHVLIWIGTAFFLAVALNPSVDFLSKYMPWRKRGFAITVVILAALGVIAFLLYSFVPPLISQSESLANNLPHYADTLVNGNGFLSKEIRHFDLVNKVRDSQSQITHYISTAGGSAYQIIKDIFSSLAAGITIIVLTIFMLLEGPRWIKIFWRTVPPKRRAHNQELVSHMYRSVSGYVNGNLLTSLIAAVTTAIMLTILGVPYAVPLGLLVAVVDLIPLVGATIAAIVVAAVAFFTSSLAGIIMIIFYLIYQQAENHVLQPIIYGKTVEMSPLTVLVAIIIGAAIAGMLGALVAIPVAASLQIIIRDYSERHFEYKEDA